MTNDEAIELAKRAIAPCKGATLEALKIVIAMADSAEDIERDNAALRKGMVAQCHCKHFKGLHPNEYSDCLVVCDQYDDDYVSMASCQCCKEFELVHPTSVNT